MQGGCLALLPRILLVVPSHHDTLPSEWAGGSTMRLWLVFASLMFSLLVCLPKLKLQFGGRYASLAAIAYVKLWYAYLIRIILSSFCFHEQPQLLHSELERARPE